MPLFTIDRETHLISGLATPFRVDPFGTYLTAYHVLECPEKKQISMFLINSNTDVIDLIDAKATMTGSNFHFGNMIRPI
ncbi:MAG: hypothetical protein NPIRA06_16180 [Nitrospirales bacterium]|nr:MAG: hypothetical protein NPIRA06_16180 [Nitrospirales bacterium]